MKISSLTIISRLISILFIILIGLSISFVIFLSFKPIKFDFSDSLRKNIIFENINVSKVGNSYLTFNKLSRQFEFLVEDIESKEVKIPNLLLGINLKNLFLLNFKPTTIKIYDSEINLNFSNSINEKINLTSFKNFFLNNQFDKFDNDFYKKIFFNFNVVELNNSNIHINGLSNNIINFKPVDLKFKKKNSGFEIRGLIKQENTKNDKKQYASFSLKRHNNLIDTKLNFKNFKLELSNDFWGDLPFKNFSIFLSGSKTIIFSEQLEIVDLKSDLTFNSNILIEKKNKIEKYEITNAKFYNSTSNNEIINQLNFNEKNSNFNFEFNFNKSDFLLSNVSIKLNKIYLNQIYRFWPENLMKETLFWIDNRMQGIVENLDINFEIKNFKISELTGSFDFKQVSVNFLDSMQNVYDLNGRAKINEDSIKFDLLGGESNKIFVENGYVKIINIKEPIESAVIDLDLKGDIEDIIHYIKNSPIKINDFERLSRLSGIPEFNLKLKFPLLNDLKIEEIFYEVNLSFKNDIFYNLYNKYTIENAYLDVQIDPSGVNYFGKGFYSGIPLKFKGKQIFNNNYGDEEIELDIDLDSNFLNEKFSFFLKNCEGKAPIKLFYSKNNSENTFEVTGQANIQELYAELKFLGIKHSYQSGLIDFNITSNYDDFTEAEISLVNESIDMFLAYKKNNKNQKFFLEHLKSELHDFSLTYEMDDSKKSLLIEGKKINIDNFFKDISHKDFTLQRNKTIEFDFLIEELFVNNNLIKNPIFSGLIKDNGFERLDVELNASDFNHKVIIFKNDFEKQIKILSDNATDFLKYFDINANTKNGKLLVEGKKKENNFDGKILIEDFIAYDTPFLTKILTFFSLDGIEQKLIDGGIIFDYLESNYSIRDFEIIFSNGFVRGSDLGLTFEGEMNFNTQDFKINGTLIPAYTLNTLITSLPIVGEIITAGSPEDGILAASFNISNINKKLNIAFNPVSVLVPSLIRNLLKKEGNSDLKN